MLQHSAEAIVRHLDVALARIWTLNERQNVLELEASAGLSTRLDGKYARVPVGKLRVGRIAQDRKLHLTNEIVNDEPFDSPDSDKDRRTVFLAGYPLLVERRLVGVLEMVSRKPLGQTLSRRLRWQLTGLPKVSRASGRRRNWPD